MDSYENVNLALYPPKINLRNNVYSDIFLYKDMAFTCIWKKMKIFKISCIIYNDKLWGDDITNSLIWIFIRTGQEMFSDKNVKFQNVTSFLISYPIFIIFAPICREIFTLSFKIMVILDWTSPLKYRYIDCIDCYRVKMNAIHCQIVYTKVLICGGSTLPLCGDQNVLYYFKQHFGVSYIISDDLLCYIDT